MEPPSELNQPSNLPNFGFGPNDKANMLFSILNNMMNLKRINNFNSINDHQNNMMRMNNNININLMMNNNMNMNPMMNNNMYMNPMMNNNMYMPPMMNVNNFGMNNMNFNNMIMGMNNMMMNINFSEPISLEPKDIKRKEGLDVK